MVDKGFVPNMKVPGTFYVNDRLRDLIFEELENSYSRGGVGGFLPAVKQLANVAALPGIVEVSHPCMDMRKAYTASLIPVLSLFFSCLDFLVVSIWATKYCSHPINPVSGLLVKTSNSSKQIPSRMSSTVENANACLPIQNASNDPWLCDSDDLDFTWSYAEMVPSRACLPSYIWAPYAARIYFWGVVQRSIALPDVHSGYGFAIGNVAAFDMGNPEAVVSPGGVGFDINCGVRLIRTNLVLPSSCHPKAWTHRTFARFASLTEGEVREF